MTSAVPPHEDQDYNASFPWDDFDTEEYFEHNYGEVRQDDSEILRTTGKFFDSASGQLRQSTGLHGIDVGTGANLYPTLAMLPFCRKITLMEHSRSNVDWLKEQQLHHWPSWPATWRQFWRVLGAIPQYASIPASDALAYLTDNTDIVQGSVFDLAPPSAERYDLGTMFFVAESITERYDEFVSAMDHFLDALRPGAPFAIALMEHSKGYDVGDIHFPGTDVDSADVRELLRGKAQTVRTRRLGTGRKPIREGYTGMILTCGRTEHTTRHHGSWS